MKSITQMFRPGHSLTATTLRAIALRISILIGLTALLSYIHISKQIEISALQTLEKYVRERSLREREIFKLAQDNHYVMRKELVEEFRKIEASTEDPVREFHSLVRLEPDGAMRSPRSRPGIKKELDIWIAKTAKFSPLFRRKIVTFSKVLLRYGPAFHTRFTDTYVALGENANLVYWPEFPDWSAGNAADFDFSTYELYYIGDHKYNPERKTLWSGLYFDDAIKEWMVSASTPIDDRNGKFSAIIGHDVMVGDLIKRTNNEGLPGTYNILIHQDGRIIAHPTKMDQIMQAKGNLKVSDTKDPVLEAIYQEVSRIPTSQRSNEKIIDHKDYDQFIAVSHMPETGWDFVTVYPKFLIRDIANDTALFIIVLGLLSLLIEMVLLYFIFRDNVSKPLQQFIQATHEIENGQVATIPLQTERGDEIGSLSRSFDSMAIKIRQANEVLREKIEQRTRELKEAQKVAMQNAHAAGMAEIATNILHNIGNTVTGVHASLHEMQAYLEDPPLSNLDKALQMIEDHRHHLAEFLSKDPKGKLLPDYLMELSKSIHEKQQNQMSTFDQILRKIKMIEDIVVSQQQYAKLGSFIEEVDMTEVVNESIGMLNLGNPRENFRLITHFDEQLPLVRAQRVKVLQIVLNLLKNALDSINQMEPTQPMEIEIRLTADSSKVRLAIRDSGQGISKENLEKIFRHGFTTKKAGHGFGLHFCINAAADLGGSLRAQSSGENLGATFILELPRAS